jgi:hypothetical protein
MYVLIESLGEEDKNAGVHNGCATLLITSSCSETFVIPPRLLSTYPVTFTNVCMAERLPSDKMLSTGSQQPAATLRVHVSMAAEVMCAVKLDAS